MQIKFSHFFLRCASKLFSPLLNGVRVVEEEWDYLIVLDACRYDCFKEINTIKGRLYRKKSLASATDEWVVKNFPQFYPDIVYFSANPTISSYMLKVLLGRSRVFFDIINIWDLGWNKKFKTVLPKTVNKIVIKRKDEYPNQRKIIHYMQPHAPFITRPNLIKDGWKMWRDVSKRKSKGKEYTIWESVRRGEIDISIIKEAYIDNLRFVLKSVKSLIKKLKGKIVITADHGESFGKYSIWEHPRSIYIRPLLEIPWFIVRK